jgi:hypothetical protein
MGKTVVLYHHTGKPNKSGYTRQRGTSKKEDVLNTSMLLAAPTQKEMDDGISFHVSFPKHRGFVPRPPKFAVTIADRNGECRLKYMDKKTMALMMHEDGDTQEKIAEELGVSQPTVSRWLKEPLAAAA